MLEAHGLVFENVSYQGSDYRFSQLMESVFLGKTLEELRRLMGPEFRRNQFVIFSGSNADAIQLEGHVPQKTFVFHISDETSSVPHALCARVRAVFKNYLPEENLTRNLFSLPLGYAATTLERPPTPILERPQSVFFSGYLSRRRLPAFHALSGSWASTIAGLLGRALRRPVRCGSLLPNAYIQFTHGFGKGLSGPEYADHLAQSKIVLCPRGFLSSETYRHFEAMRAGSIIVSEPLPPLRFYQGSPIITLDRWRGVRERLLELVSQPDRLVSLQKQTLAWWSDQCCELATAAYVARVINSLD